jgi:hypothetical protein
MKKIITILSLCVFSLTSIAAETAKKEPEKKKVCVMQKDTKSGKEKEVCREMKVHKKLDGTKVPENKK